MKNKTVYLIAVFFLFTTMASAAWPPWFMKNQFNKEGLRHGRWVYYWSDTHIPMNKLHFKNGRESGMNRYYTENGKKWLQFNFFRDDRIKVTYYDDYGRKEKKGEAIMIYNPEEIRYSWNGKWRFYENGKVFKTVIYEMGVPIEEDAEKEGTE